MPLRKRSNTSHLRRRIPLRFAELDPRTFGELTLYSSDRAKAERLAAAEWAKLLKV